MAVQFTVFGTLALRYKDRIIADWLVVYFRYKARPRVYVFNKNDIFARELPVGTSKLKEETATVEEPSGKGITKYDKSVEPSYLRTIIAVKPSKKGGLDVEYQEA